jgi:hypothetical protein
LSFLRSLIAAYLGNIVGALFVGLPAVYCYLGNYNFRDTQLKNLENGVATGSGPANHTSSSSASHEVYDVESKQS